MCGRFARYSATSELAWRYFETRIDQDFDAPRYNVAPGTDIEAFRASDKAKAAFQPMHWGFRPKRVTEGPQPINARAEKVASSPYFRSAFAHRRCIIPADGWFEWQLTGQGKQPHFITLTDDAPQDVLFLAGIWEPTAEGGACCAIITEPASEQLAFIHARQPLALDATCRWDWLDPAITDREQVRHLTRRLPPSALQAYPVSTRVNRPQNDDPSILDPTG
ncbi:SOS response-associated peptidase [Thioalkalivibrio sp. ALE17]|uniref:SOS response-associated peptidase n=1 Tax=Thioalkalivibrio sp. ALE17 TaxID=1158173 RepID=UPI00040DD649|nr:SOS response-associated peptidase [Thioalkalivibrio sp. ALE17]